MRAALFLLLALLASCTCAQQADVVLYGEALCPYTIAALNEVILPLFDGGLAGKFSFAYLAYGNAKRTSDGATLCQHGPAECRLNRDINCAAELASGQSQFVPFLRCLSSKKAFFMEHSVGDCAKEAGLSPEALSECATGERGLALEQEAAAATGALHPPHTYVPWLVVNGVPLGQDDYNLYKYICVALPQNQQPEECFVPPDHKALAIGGEGARAGQLGRSSSSQMEEGVVELS